MVKNTELAILNEPAMEIGINLTEHEAVQARIPTDDPFQGYGNMMENHRRVGDDDRCEEYELEINEQEIEIEEKNIADNYELEI